MAGTDMFADTNDVDSVREAYVKGLFTSERLDEAASLLLGELFALGLFENPYADPEEADRVVANAEAAAAAKDAHRRSVVLAKNHDAVLPLTAEALAGKRVYLELFAKDLLVKDLEALRRGIVAAHPGIDFTTDHRGADVAIVILAPFIGSYFEFVGIGDLAIDDHSHVDIARVREIRESVGTMVVALDAKFPWLLDGVEPLADALLVGFDTDRDVLVDAVLGEFAPTGKLPITFPIDAAALAVDEDGRCASPNDVPGFAKEQHMDGRPYVYVDTDGNRYALGHGLTW
jgi:beta-glucosidase